MQEPGNQTVMCSVLFLDIVEYSRKSVTGQISLKDRFNSYLSQAIRDVPVADRLILDTGDGAVVNFLGNVEEALKAALDLRDSLLKEHLDIEPPLRVRMGINLGPVRLVRDINGQPNILGDGINVAQRVMSFANASQIFVSRSYYDAVTTFSPEYAALFHYQGSRTDKHVREHEVYAVANPGDKTTQRNKIKLPLYLRVEKLVADTVKSAKTAWYSAAMRLDVVLKHLLSRYKQANLRQRALYVGVASISALLLTVLTAKLIQRNEVHMIAGQNNKQAASAIQSATPVAPEQSAAADNAKNIRPQTSAQPKRKLTEGEAAKHQSQLASGQPARQAGTPQNIPPKSVAAPSSANAAAFVSVRCREGTEIFVDGVRKGRISYQQMTLVIPPGRHTVIVSHTKAGVYSQDVMLEAGKTVHLHPDFCN